VAERRINCMEKLTEIAAAFPCSGTYLGEEPYGSGHINDTYKVFYQDDGESVHYIRQRINSHVFKDVPSLMENIGQVTRHHRNKLEAAGVDDLGRRVLTLIPTQEGMDYYQDSEGYFWRTYVFVEGALGIDVIENTQQAYEAAKAFGEFQCQLADLPGRLHETIPRFHDTRSRFDTLVKAIEEDEFNRAASVKKEIEFAMAHEKLADSVIQLMASGELPERVTHNDTKLNNVLIDTITGKGICVIDLDTVMPGSVLYDFGDMVRSSTTNAPEDEPDVSKINMDINYFEALVNGYLETASGFLVPKELELLSTAGPLITFETGLRFLTDHLNGDIYFKTKREGQNMDRCRKQFKMVQSMEEQRDAMQKIVDRF